VRSNAELRTNAVQLARASRSRPWQLSAVDRVLRVRPWITGAFERKAYVRTQAYFQMPINRPLDHLDEIVFLWAIFKECFAIVGHTLPSLFVNTYY
jgi:hypothetical protein